MRLLLDTCMWGGGKGFLCAQGYDVEWVGEWSSDPGDSEILAYAHRTQRILVTLNKDFGEMAIVKGAPHSGIIRLVDTPAREQAALCHDLLVRYAQEIAAGAILTADMRRVRIRPA